mgnify:CR=1 FL=1
MFIVFTLFSHTRIDEKKYINIPLEIPTLRIIKQECFISIKTQTQRRMSQLILPTKKTKKYSRFKIRILISKESSTKSTYINELCKKFKKKTKKIINFHDNP